MRATFGSIKADPVAEAPAATPERTSVLSHSRAQPAFRSGGHDDTIGTSGSRSLLDNRSQGSSGAVLPNKAFAEHSYEVVTVVL
jgi:hypothetical protein